MAGNPDNLIPNSERTPEELREQTRKAGIASGEARRKKKIITQLYTEWLEKKHKVGGAGDITEMSGHEMLSKTVSKVLARGDSSSVSMMREIRETIEGQKVEHAGEMNIIYLDKQDEKL